MSVVAYLREPSLGVLLNLHDKTKTFHVRQRGEKKGGMGKSAEVGSLSTSDKILDIAWDLRMILLADMKILELIKTNYLRNLTDLQGRGRQNTRVSNEHEQKGEDGQNRVE